ncbi:MAG: hypothetical protein IJR21_09850 [Synergistaceae bacterium]|nr:hypothetical protein [Synergistaceae bacterium]
MNKNKWLRFIPFLPLLLLLICVNIYLDAGNRFHDLGDLVAQSLLNGNPTYVRHGNLDERKLKQCIMANMPNYIDCAAVGSSIVLCVSSGDAGQESFFNLGTATADFYDILSQLGFMASLNKKLGRLIFCIDAIFFAESIYNSSAHQIIHARMKQYADYIIKIMDGENVKAPEYNGSILARLDELFYQLFSVAYFQSNIAYLKNNINAKNINSESDPRYGIVKDTENYPGFYYMPDGSLVYPKGSRDSYSKDNNIISDDDRNTPVNYGYNFDRFISAEHEHASEYSKKYLDKLIKYLIDNGTQVEIFLCPLAPALWDAYDENLRPILSEAENYCHEMAAKYNLKLTGSYNPYKVGIRNSDYYDARHVRREMLSKYFDFKP